MHADENTGADTQNHLYNGKELDRMHGLNLYDYHARQYDPVIGQFTSMDPLCEKYYHISPYAYCAGNPINAIDPNGCDTLHVGKNDDGIWNITSYVKGGDSDVYFIEGQDEPVVCNSDADISQVALEINDDCTLSVINVKGESIYGFAVTPSGPTTGILESGTPVQEGLYTIESHNYAGKWRCAGPKVMGYDITDGVYKDRGIRIHYAGYDITSSTPTRASVWTEGCSVVSSAYTISNGKIKFKPNESYTFYSRIQTSLGGTPFSYKGGGKTRYGFSFSKPINKIMQYKYRKLPM